MDQKEEENGFQLRHAPKGHQGAAETHRNLLELFYNPLQESYNKMMNDKKILHTKFMKKLSEVC